MRSGRNDGSTNRAPDYGASAYQISQEPIRRARWRGDALLRRLLWHLRPRLCGGRGRGALAEPGLPLLPGAQRTGRGARGHGLRQGQEPPANLRLPLLHRPRRHQHDHRRSHGHHQPPAGAALAGRHLRPPQCGPGPAAARIGPQPGRLGQRLLQAGQQVLGSHQPARSDPDGPARGHARADQPQRDRRGDAGPAAGRADRGFRLSARVLPPARLAHHAQPGRPGQPAGRGRIDPRSQTAHDRGRRRGDLRRRHRDAARLRGRHRHPRGRDHGWQGQPALGPPAKHGRDRRHRHAGRQPHCPGLRPGDRHRHPLQRLHYRLQDRLAAPRRALRQHQRGRVRRRQAQRAGPGGRWQRGAGGTGGTAGRG